MFPHRGGKGRAAQPAMFIDSRCVVNKLWLNDNRCAAGFGE
jgi:hypothetical protein